MTFDIFDNVKGNFTTCSFPIGTAISLSGGYEVFICQSKFDLKYISNIKLIIFLKKQIVMET